MFNCRLWSTLIAVVFVGCRSIAPEKELDLSSNVVARRSGVVPHWIEGPTAPPQLGASLSLHDATRRALTHHPVIRSEIARVTEARADFAQAHLLPNPVVSIAYGFPLDGGGGNPLMASVVEQMAALWTRSANVDRAAAALRARVLQLSDRALKLVFEVRTAYSEVVHGIVQSALAARRVELLIERRSLVESQYDVGEASLRGVNLARLEEAQARDRALRIEEASALARRRLAELIGLPESDLESVGFQLESDPLPEEIDERRCIELAGKQRLDVAAAFAAIGEASVASRLASLDRLPDISAGVGLQRNFNNREAFTPSIRIVPDVFDTGHAAKAKAEAIEARSRHEAQRLLANAVLEARSAYIEFCSTRARRQALERQALPAARENATLSKRSFQVGAAPRTDWLTDQARALEIEREVDELRLAERRAFYALEWAIGGTFEDGPVPTDLAKRRGP